MDSLSLFSTITLHDIQLELQYKVRPQCSSARTKIHTIDRTTLVPQWFGPLHLRRHCNFLFDGHKDDRKVYFLLSSFLFLQKIVVLARVETKHGTLACLNKSSASMSVTPHPFIPLRVDMLFCCIVCKLEDNSWSRQEHPATQCGLLMAEQRGDGL